MMKLIKSLPFLLFMGIVIGMLLGLVLPEGIIVVVVTIKYILEQIITFCVPLIIIGFIAPSITKLGNNATRMLTVAIVIAYASSVLAAFLSMFTGFLLIPHMTIVTDTGGLRVLPEVSVQLDVPQIMPVMSALVFSIFIGIAAVWSRAETITRVLQEFQQIVLKIVEKVVIPILPFFIAATFCCLTWEGSITKQLPIFLIVIVIVLVGHFIWLTVLYGAASVYSGRSALRQYPPLRICPDRGFLRHDCLESSLRTAPFSRIHDPFCHTSRHLCHRSPRRSRRYSHGFPGSDHRNPRL